MLEISGLSFGYRTAMPIFRNLGLGFTPGVIYGLLGKNGAGKTTLLKLLSGLLFPDSGKCLFDGRSVAERRPETLKDFYFLPEVSYLPPLSIARFAQIYSPFYPQFDPAWFEKCLEMFELNKYEKIQNLSYGEKKKLSLAFAFSANTRVILLDEPTNGLDIPSKSAFRKIIASAVTADKILIASTHQVKDMKNIIDQVLIIEAGKIIFNRNISEIENRLSVVKFQSGNPPENSLFYEKEFSGGTALVEKTDDSEADIDFEFLFNAVTTNSGLINNVFSKGAENEPVF